MLGRENPAPPVQHADDLLVYLAPGAVKAAPVGEHLTEVSGLCLVFDDDASGRDLSGEYFTSQTFFGPGIRAGKSAEVEATYHHGIATRPEFKGLAAHDFSHGVTVTKTDAGLLASLILDERDEYEAAVAKAARAGKLGWSTGSAPHRVRKSDSGQIERWPLVEVALTPAPCEPRTYAGLAGKTVPLHLFPDGSDAPPVAAAMEADALKALRDLRCELDTVDALKALRCSL